MKKKVTSFSQFPKKWSNVRLFNDLPSLPDTLSKMRFNRQSPLRKYQDKTRRFWNQSTEWQLFAQELEAEIKHRQRNNIAEEQALMLLHQQDDNDSCSSADSGSDISGDRHTDATDLDVALFDRRWAQLEEAIQSRAPIKDGIGERMPVSRRVALFDLEPWAKRYETAIYTKKRDKLIQMLKGLQEQDEHATTMTSEEKTEILFEAHGAARCSVFSTARKIQTWWRHLLRRTVIKYRKHSWPQRMRERHLLKLRGGLFAKVKELLRKVTLILPRTLRT